MIKKKIKFSSYTYWEIQSGAVAKSYIRKGFRVCHVFRKKKKGGEMITINGNIK